MTALRHEQKPAHASVSPLRAKTGYVGATPIWIPGLIKASLLVEGGRSWHAGLPQSWLPIWLAIRALWGQTKQAPFFASGHFGKKRLSHWSLNIMGVSSNGWVMASWSSFRAWSMLSH